MDASPASRVIARFGGQSNLARLLEKRPSTVQYWGSTGRIPPRWHGDLLKLAGQEGINLTPSELVALPGTDSDNPLPKTPTAKWAGVLPIGDNELPCYVLADGRRVISRTGATSSLTGRTSGNLESYIGVEALRGFVPDDFADQMIEFTLEGVTKQVGGGITAESFLDICRA